ncbi:YhfC family intramembrane metalloprotease [Neobacillus muris]|uniref:YhfC family intramembrane metalloprotease n=1 Tax=Neobacillus muris TaxID=2941334 RepID=UPI00203FDC1A|nr:YhfC family glutamic-type intramembrane protease [Neobacillus muris]
MISNTTIVAMFIPILFSFLLFGGFIVVYKKRAGISKKPLILGFVGFIIFSQVLEKALHAAVLICFPHYANHPVWFGLYGGLAAGIFEEVGRFILFIWLLKQYRDYQSGISFGVGWGGGEAIILTVTTVLPNILFAFLMNNGTIESELGSQVPAEMIDTIKEGVLSHGAAYYLWGCVERFFAIFIQLFLSLFVLLAAKIRKISYLIYAIIIHAAIDFPLVFFQSGQIKQIWIIELYIAIIGCLAFYLIKRLRAQFS